MTVRSRLVWFFPLLLVSLALDQLTKFWARGALVEGVSKDVLGAFWKWRLSFNTGVAFSMFSDLGAGRIILPVIAAVVFGVVAWMALKSETTRRSRLAGVQRRRRRAGRGRDRHAAVALATAGARRGLTPRAPAGILAFVLNRSVLPRRWWWPLS
jgi:hypothetical protein